jgi:hypothetical protein
VSPPAPAERFIADVNVSATWQTPRPPSESGSVVAGFVVNGSVSAYRFLHPAAEFSRHNWSHVASHAGHQHRENFTEKAWLVGMRAQSRGRNVFRPFAQGLFGMREVDIVSDLSSGDSSPALAFQVDFGADVRLWGPLAVRAAGAWRHWFGEGSSGGDDFRGAAGVTVLLGQK